MPWEARVDDAGARLDVRGGKKGGEYQDVDESVSRTALLRFHSRMNPIYTTPENRSELVHIPENLLLFSPGLLLTLIHGLQVLL